LFSDTEFEQGLLGEMLYIGYQVENPILEYRTIKIIKVLSEMKANDLGQKVIH